MSMRRPALTAIVAVACVVLIACGGDAQPKPEHPSVTATPATSAARTVETGGPLVRPHNWIYWLSDIDLQAIADLHPALAVIDYSRDGAADTVFSRSDIEALRSDMSSPALVISYMSIGEAEDYRYYWEQGWLTDPPVWIDRENRNWPGNYKVKFWEPEWQSLIFGSPDSYLDRIISAGFDGVYLDIIDAYEYFTERGRATAEDEMVAFVADLSSYAKTQNPDFLVIPQNAPELGERADYMAVVDGIGMEGVYFGWEEVGVATRPEDTEWLEEQLARFSNAGKTVLAVDYAFRPDDVAEAYRRSRGSGFVPTVADVALAGLPYPEPLAGE